MKKVAIFILLLLMVVACSVDNSPIAERSAAEVTATAVPPTPTLSTPRLEEEPAPPTAVPTEPPPPATTVPTDEPTATAEPEPTETAVPTVEVVATEVEAEGGVLYGRTPEGAFFHGDPNAPITMIDFSDFL